MSSYICHDFKTPRPDSSGRLPSAFMLVPILVYVALLGGTAFNIHNYVKFRDATQNRDKWKQLQAEKDEGQARFESQIAGLKVNATRAEKLAQWIEGTRTLQPVAVAIIRSMPAETTLSEMTFDRSAEMPAQVNISVRMNGGTMEEVGRIQSAVQNLSYQPYNSQNLKTNDNLEYKTMLVWHQR